MKKIEILNDATFAEGKPLPLADKLIEGTPALTSWVTDNLRDGAIRAGMWESTPGTIRVIKGDTFEFCTVITGKAQITGEDGEVTHLKAGDTLVMRPGFVGAWKTIETMRKYWVIVQ